ncbi:MAB_1171c family putative transporter [Streptomyces sp. NPDC059564]|uniref:MAB_1171c family putative transporter n=1 Tax=Streptomyces sp. NPDC059564 TaxID=3346865 RepID=UPI00367FF3AE
MHDTDYYIPAAALVTAFLLRTPGLIRNWRLSMVRSANLLILLGAAGFAFGAPPTISFMNRVTGVVNFSAPLVYVILCGYNLACLVLIENWLGGDDERTRRRIRRWRVVYITAISLVIVCFAVGDAPDERLVDFDTYYANTPWIYGVIVTYLLAHMVASTAITIMCWRGVSQVRSWTRVGLWVLVAGFILNLAYGVAKLTAVAARWANEDLDRLSTSAAPPIVAAGGVIVTIGFLIPLLGPKVEEQVRAAADHFRMRPLWQLVRPTGSGAPGVLKAPLWSSPAERLTFRVSATQDRILRLHPFFDDQARRVAYDQGQEAGLPERQAAARGIAAMLSAAADRCAAGGEVPAPTATARTARDEYLAAEATHTDLLLDVAAQLRDTLALRTVGMADTRQESLS